MDLTQIHVLVIFAFCHAPLCLQRDVDCAVCLCGYGLGHVRKST